MPTEFVLLVSPCAGNSGVVPRTDSFKPSGTEWATVADVEAAGFVDAAWKAVALEALRALRDGDDFGWDQDTQLPHGVLREVRGALGIPNGPAAPKA